MNSKTYSVGIMAQAFWFNEMKQFLKLKKDQYSAEEIRKIVIEENLFGAPNEYRAKRMYGYISKRASAVEEDLTNLFFSSDLSTQKIINVCVCQKIINVCVWQWISDQTVTFYSAFLFQT